MREYLKNYLRKSFLYDILRPVIQKRQYKTWLESGKSGAAPSLETQKVVKEYGQKFHVNCLIETGTFRGDMVNAQKNNFAKIYSIELNQSLAEKASERFKKYSHIEIYQGNSTDVLPKILEKVKNSNCLFWLDAHYSAGITSRSEKDSPIMDELEIIFATLKQNVVLLIDDARNFVGENGYPTMEELKNYIEAKKLNYVFECKEDIVRVHPVI
jgi:hypothetical protein